MISCRNCLGPLPNEAGHYPSSCIRYVGHSTWCIGVLVFVADALLLRLIGGDMLDAFVWRGILAGSVFLIWSYGISNVPRLTLRESLSGLCLLVTVLEGASMILFCASNGHISVSNALVIFATAPLIAAALSWVFLRVV